MRSNLTYSLNEIAEIYDGPHATPKKLEKGNAIFLSISSIENGRLNLGKSSFISDDDFVKWTSRVTPQAGDVVFSYETKIGEASIIPEGLRCCLGRRMGLLRAKQNKVLPQYLLYAYLSPAFQDVIREKTIHGSTTDRLSIKEMPSFKIELPDIHTQKKVIKILDSIDNKLFKNAEINQTLDQMAQALFKSWFIDFEPVKAKIALLDAGGTHEEATLAAMTAISGKDSDGLVMFEREHSEQYAELKATAELFPSAMQESVKGHIPQGWEYRKIGNYVDNISKTYPLKNVEQVVFLNTGDIKEGIFLHKNKSDVNSLPGQAKKSTKEGDILYSEIRPINKRFAFVYFNADEYVVSTKLMVLRPKLRELSYYLYFFLSSHEVISYLQVMAESRSGTFPQITYDTVSNIKILTSPDESVFKSFSKFLGENLYIPQQSLIKQNEILTNIRETLLPKLLSGEITLPEIEKALSEVENV